MCYVLLSASVAPTAEVRAVYNGSKPSLYVNHTNTKNPSANRRVFGVDISLSYLRLMLQHPLLELPQQPPLRLAPLELLLQEPPQLIQLLLLLERQY